MFLLQYTTYINYTILLQIITRLLVLISFLYCFISSADCINDHVRISFDLLLGFLVLFSRRTSKRRIWFCEVIGSCLTSTSIHCFISTESTIQAIHDMIRNTYEAIQGEHTFLSRIFSDAFTSLSTTVPHVLHFIFRYPLTHIIPSHFEHFFDVYRGSM